MKNNNIIFTINGINYLMVEILITNKKTINENFKMALKYGGIYQGVKELKQNFFSHNYIILNFLIPINKINEFNKDFLK